MIAAPPYDPIFVHASARSGSTYLFNVFRRNESLLCFNEAIIDGKKDYAHFRNPVKRYLLRPGGARKWDTNHHFLEREDFDEFIDAWDAVMHLCPEFPTYQDYLPSTGRLSSELTAYLAALMEYALSRNKRPVLCEINSRGRAGALRSHFGGFHIAQYRDPLAQFGSFVRALEEAGSWIYLVTPVIELGTSEAHPLAQLIPEAWRAPALPWRVQTRAQHWASDARYTAAIAAPQPEAAERLFRWHLFSWALGNLAAISYSDMIVDIDKIHDDAAYSASIVDEVRSRLDLFLDFSDSQKFVRYCTFESFDLALVCRQVASTIENALTSGRLAEALCALARQQPAVPAATAVKRVLDKIDESIEAMNASDKRNYISASRWKDLAEKNQKLWFNPCVRLLAEHIYRFAAPIGRTARRVGMPV